MLLSLRELEQDTLSGPVCRSRGGLSNHPVLVSECGNFDVALDRVRKRAVSDHGSQWQGCGNPHQSDVDHVHRDDFELSGFQEWADGGQSDGKKFAKT